MPKPRIKPPKPSGGRHISQAALLPEAPDPDRLPPKFSLRHLHRDYCITRCTDEERLAFVSKMYRMSPSVPTKPMTHTASFQNGVHHTVSRLIRSRPHCVLKRALSTHTDLSLSA